MLCRDLLLELKNRIKRYKARVNPENKYYSNFAEDPLQLLISDYNRENFHEIIKSSRDCNFNIKDEELKDLENYVDNYFILYGTDDKDLKEFIKIIIIYLVFIAKKPLHPPGIKFPHGKTVYKKGDSYYCTGKSVYLKDEYSLCKFCIARKEPLN
jgi:uncharacterized protein (UPF0305 family)